MMMPQTNPTTILSLVFIMFKSLYNFLGNYKQSHVQFYQNKSISIIAQNIMNLFKVLALVIFFIIGVHSAKHNVTQLTPKNFNETIKNNDFTVVYVYSSSCKYCSQFTPLFESLSVQQFNKKVAFTKIDGNLYQEQIKMFDISSFPTIMLFWKGFFKPIYFRQQRNKQKLKDFLSENFQIVPFKIQDSQKISIYQKIQQKWVFYYGNQQSQAYKMMGLIWKRDRFFRWTLIKSQVQKILIGSSQIQKNDFSIQLVQATIQKNFARLYELDQQPWVRMFKNKQLTIVYINTQQNKKVPKLLQKLAKQYTDIVFLHIPSNHPQYKSALKVIGVLDQQNILAVDKRADGVFLAKSPYTQQGLRDFIQKVKKYEWPVYRKTERTTIQNKLTRQNYYQKMETKQDVLLFLYNRNEKISKDLVDLFNFLIKKFQSNKNLLLLRCDVSSNELEQYLGFMVDKTPKIVFFRNRMKDKPIHYYGGKISAKNTIQFIMENTTFDWQDQWGQL